MTRFRFAVLAAAGFLWPSLALAERDVPGANAGEAEIAVLVAWRSALFDDIIAGSQAGACPVDKL